MCGVLANNHTLRTLLANDNLIDSDGAVALLESATSSRDGRLRTLALRRNQLSEARVERMVQLLNARSALAKFEVAGNPVAGNRAFQQVRNTVDIT